jgi:hypothetical protein
VEISLTWRCAIWLCATLWFGTTLNGAVAEPKRVLLLNSFGRDFSPWSEYSRDIRAELVRQFGEPVDIFDASSRPHVFLISSKKKVRSSITFVPFSPNTGST